MTKSTDIIKLVNDDRALELKNQGELIDVLRKDPPTEWIKKHPFANGVNYLPIGKVEHLLDVLFLEWRIEVLSISQLAQSIVCVARVHYRNPISGDWSFHDGVGAVPLKTDKGFSAADLSHIKSDAVMTGAPAAKSFAIKDAAEHLGDLFGRNLNRDDDLVFKNIYENAVDTRSDDRLAKLQEATNEN